MLEITVAAIAYVVNIGVSFLSEGTWKTAGNSIAQLYWQSCRPAEPRLRQSRLA
jgi:hypothetical protein